MQMLKYRKDDPNISLSFFTSIRYLDSPSFMHLIPKVHLVLQASSIDWISKQN